MPGDLSFAAAAGSHSGYTAQKGKTTDSDAHMMPPDEPCSTGTFNLKFCDCYAARRRYCQLPYLDIAGGHIK